MSLFRRLAAPMTLSLILATGCQQSPTAVDPPLFDADPGECTDGYWCQPPCNGSDCDGGDEEYYIEECNPLGDPGCRPRPLTYDEMMRVVSARGTYAANGCTELTGWFSSGWGERVKAWDNEVFRTYSTTPEIPLQGDYHRSTGEIHVFSGATNWTRTLAHEILHDLVYNGHASMTHSEIRARAEQCAAAH